MSMLPMLITLSPAASKAWRASRACSGVLLVASCCGVFLTLIQGVRTCRIISIAFGRSNLRKLYVAMPSLMPQGVDSTRAEAEGPAAAPSPARPATPRNPRRVVGVFITPSF